jgi:hypothetical protein
MKKTILLFVTASVLFSACNDIYKVDIKTKGMKPIYANSSVSTVISNSAVQPMLNTGKILIWNQYILLNEYNKGIHIINNTDKTNPQKIGFISIPFNKDLSIKNNQLYVDNGKDLVVLDVSDILHVTEISRISNMFTKAYDDYPLNYSGYFECVDPNKGMVVGWEETNLVNPECKTF